VNAGGFKEGYSIMERLIEIRHTELHPTLRALSSAGVTVDDATWLRRDGNAALVEAFIRRTRDQYPFKQSIREQLAALHEQNNAGNWGIPMETFSYLVARAPKWPKGRDAYRSFRIRFGEGVKGVAKTFEAHAAAMKRVFGNRFWRWDSLLSGKTPHQRKGGEDVERLRLLNGNDTHRPTVQWVIIPDLSVHRQREDITSVRNPLSLADEGLVLAWLNPKRAEAVDYEEWPAWFCAGYELNVPEHDEEPWQSVVVVGRSGGDSEASLSAYLRNDSNPSCSVPCLKR